MSARSMNILTSLVRGLAPSAEVHEDSDMMTTWRRLFFWGLRKVEGIRIRGCAR